MLETTALKTIRQGHSKKPKEVYEIIKNIFNIDIIEGLELFGTKRLLENDFLDIYGDQLPEYFDEVVLATDASPTTSAQVNDILYT